MTIPTTGAPHHDPLGTDDALRLQTLLLERMREGVTVSDEQGYIVYTNPAEDHMFGYEPGALVGRHVTVQFALTPEESARLFAAVIEQLRAGGQWEGDLERARSDGSRFIAHARVSALEMSGRTYWVCIQEDVTEQRRARAVADQAERRLGFLARASAELAGSLDVQAALETVADFAVPELADWCFVEILDANGIPRPQVVRHQDPAKVAYGWAVMIRYPIKPENQFGSMLVARTGEPVLVPEIPPGVFEAIAHDAEHLRLLRETGFTSSVQAPLRAGGVVMGVLTLAMTAESGRRFDEADFALVCEVAARVSIALENAHLYAAERRARADAEEARARADAARIRADEASRAKSDFLAVMSHEFRTPLNAIAGYAELIEIGVHGPITDEQRTALARMRTSQRHLAGLVNEVLDYARIEAGAVRYASEPVLLADVVTTCEALTAPQMREKALRFVRHGVDGAVVRADREKLRQIVLNLLSNAMKFTDADGTIMVTTERRGANVALHVSDTGCGIDPDQAARIFEPFVQADYRRTREHGGVGLGLAICRDLARGMGGDVSVVSAVGIGSTFTLTLPAG
ncbi:MAG TPA: ATP-binding protein [Gemmatimonadaceae bacterium]|nr:ATP-binding protein [Gemmatimonadaceae bacterium]